MFRKDHWESVVCTDARQVGVFVCLLMDEATCVGVFVCCELHLMDGRMLSQQGQGIESEKEVWWYDCAWVLSTHE